MTFHGLIRGFALLAAGLLLGMAVGFFASSPSRKVHAQEGKAEPTPETPDQGWKVVPNIQPSDLELELKKINDEGFTVNISNIKVVDDRFVIILSGDDEVGKEEEDP
jgi:hypothetical protein